MSDPTSVTTPTATPDEIARILVERSPGSRAPVRPRRVERLERGVVVPRSLDDTFAFFGDARNLDRLTPPWVGFRILTPAPIEMRVGTLIDYSIRIHGVGVRWKTLITRWEPPHRFVDVQLKGPYRWWHHEHRFEPVSGGTRVVDAVEYAAPLAWISHPLLVRRDVARIFEYRESALREVLGGAG